MRLVFFGYPFFQRRSQTLSFTIHRRRQKPTEITIVSFRERDHITIIGFQQLFKRKKQFKSSA
jgi:hypothetical protein